MGSLIPAFAKVGDSLAALRQASVIVDNDEADRLDVGIQRGEGVPGGFIEVAIYPLQSNALDRGVPERYLEPSFLKLHLTIKQAIALEQIAHRLIINSQHGYLPVDKSKSWSASREGLGNPSKESASHTVQSVI